MNGNDFIPGTVEGFKSYSDEFMNTLSDIGAEDLMPPPVYHEFVRLWDDYGKKYAVSENRETRTTVTIFERDEAQALFEKELRRIIKSYIVYNPQVTDAQRIELGVPVHKTTKTKVKAPYTKVVFIVKLLDSRRLLVQFHDEEIVLRNDSKSHKRPYAYTGAIIACGVSTSPATDIRELDRRMLATRTPHTIEFPASESGLIASLSACWQNEKGEIGPWADIQWVHIP